ncbi:MAG: enoyl-CoA hydratase [Gammaproteobacteria bacterium]|nr:enoyl-CoA hydratase [Gammaproteobacteria bacterium]MDH5171052.1 enoyl-CoA hydratase [Gammaproteobacteria bacterium]
MARRSGKAATTVAEQSPSSPYVLAELSGHVLWLTLNRPDQRNPLSSQMIAALAEAVSAAGDDSRVRVIVIASTGPVFSAGHDLREMGRRDGETKKERAARVRGILDDCARMMLTIVHSPKAVIACVEGVATAAGCQLVSACDLALASEQARFCTPGVNIGTFCTTPLVGIGRNIHRKHAMEMALTGEMMSAADAVRFGLVNRALPADALRAEVGALAAKIAGKSARAIRAGKETFYRQVDMPLEQAFSYATEAMVEGLLSSDAAEGTRAFLEKRSPQWGDA